MRGNLLFKSSPWSAPFAIMNMPINAYPTTSLHVCANLLNTPTPYFRDPQMTFCGFQYPATLKVDGHTNTSRNQIFTNKYLLEDLAVGRNESGVSSYINHITKNSFSNATDCMPFAERAGQEAFAISEKTLTQHYIQGSQRSEFENTISLSLL